MKNILKILIPAVALGLGGCNKWEPYIAKYKDQGDLHMSVTRNGMGYFFGVEEKDSEGKIISKIIALDNDPYSKENIGDGRLDEITLLYVPKGSELEKYSIEELNDLYMEVRETGSERR